MKRKLILIFTMLCLGIFSFVILFVYKPKVTENAIREAIQKSGRTPLKIIYQDKVKDGIVIFFTKNILDLKKADLACGFLRNTSSGWQWVIGGEHGGIKDFSNGKGFSYQYFPNTKGTPFPVYFGAITNPNINQIKLIEQKRNIVIKTNIIKNDYVDIWYVYMNKYQGSKFYIIGYSADGKEVGKVQADISPYSAEQKPMKQ
jgi:hypothetical protein